MEKKLVVCKCKHCIEDLKNYNPYVYDNGESVPLENIVCVEIPYEMCVDIDLDPFWVDEMPEQYQIIKIGFSYEVLRYGLMMLDGCPDYGWKTAAKAQTPEEAWNAVKMLCGGK